jgi:hypothetical protein
MDVPTFCTTLAAQLDNQNARVVPFLQDSVVRMLAEISAVREILWTEGTGSFTTTPNQSDYPTGQEPGTTPYAGMPPDVAEFDSFYLVTSSNPSLLGVMIMGPVPISRLRSAIQGGLWQGLWPIYWAFHHGAVVLGPLPSQTIQIAFDYRRDATRDSLTGVQITQSLCVAPAGTGITNPWFNEMQGYNIFRAMVLADYHSSISKDEQQRQYQQESAQTGIENMKRRWYAMKGQGWQAPRNFGEAWDRWGLP